MLDEVHQGSKTSLETPEEHDQSFDAVRVKYINLDCIKSVLLTKLESSTSQRQTKVTYKIDYGADDNLMPFKIFKYLFLKAMVESLHATKITG